MLNRIKNIFGADTENAEVEKVKLTNDMQVAAAALLIEAAYIDNDYDESEQTMIAELVRGRFDLNDEEVADLIQTAEKAVADAVDYFRFARTIKEKLSHEECIQLMEMLWEVILADGRIDSFEANLMERIGGLLYVTGRESAEARKKAKQAMKARG